MRIGWQIILYLARNSNFHQMKRIAALFLTLLPAFLWAQSPWPSESWNSATALTSVMNVSGLLELSGLHWNPQTNRLYVVHGDGGMRVLLFSPEANSFTQIGNRVISGGPEGITQTDYSADQFYVIDENNYLIKQYSNLPNFSSVTLTASWNLLNAPSPMQDTGNTGPEGIVFIPDANLSANGFISSVTGQPYTSVKGAGGLFFIAHQDGGYIWVFDINPNANNDFAYVGKYKTSRNESSDLAFDRSTGLLYILHNIGSNYIEVTDLSLAPVSETKFKTISEYFVANPSDGNINIEGFALMPKCGSVATASAFLCRDVESDEATAIKQDAIRWFNPFTADGECAPLAVDDFDKSFLVSVFPNPGSNQVTISMENGHEFSAKWTNVLGQTVLKTQSFTENPIDVASLQSGLYFIEVQTTQGSKVVQWIKK